MAMTVVTYVNKEVISQVVTVGRSIVKGGAPEFQG